MAKQVSLQVVIWPLAMGVLLLVAWYLAVWLFGIPEYQLPPPHRIVEAAIEEQSLLLSGGAQTTIACLLGFFISVVGGLFLSVLLASS